jgi:hypothetical protein
LAEDLAGSLPQPLTMALTSHPGAFTQGMQTQYFEAGPSNPHLVHVFHVRSQNNEKPSISFVMSVSVCLSVCLSVRPAGRLSAWKNAAPTGPIFVKSDI